MSSIPPVQPPPGAAPTGEGGSSNNEINIKDVMDTFATSFGSLKNPDGTPNLGALGTETKFISEFAQMVGGKTGDICNNQFLPDMKSYMKDPTEKGADKIKGDMRAMGAAAQESGATLDPSQCNNLLLSGLEIASTDVANGDYGAAWGILDSVNTVISSSGAYPDKVCDLATQINNEALGLVWDSPEAVPPAQVEQDIGQLINMINHM